MSARLSQKKHVLAKPGLSGEEKRRATGTIAQVDRRSSRQEFPHDVDMRPGRGQVLEGDAALAPPFPPPHAEDPVSRYGMRESRQPNVPVEMRNAVLCSMRVVLLRLVHVGSRSYGGDWFSGGGR